MPDPVSILIASAAAAALAAGILLLFGWPWRAPRAGRVAAGGAVGVGVGLFIGAWLLGLAPHFPPSEDQDRLLLVLLPAAVAVEIAAAFIGRAAWLAWSLRLVVAAAASRVLLHGSIYLADPAGSGTRGWSPAQAALMLGGLAAALAAGWALLDRLARQSAGRAVPLCLALACAGSGITVMLSSYATGGQLGFPLAAALASSAIASFFLAEADPRGSIGVGVVGLFALLLVGRFFGELTTANAVLLFAAPLLGWLPEVPQVRRFGPRLRACAAVALTAVPVAVALALAVQQFNAESAPRSAAPGTREPSIEDYMNFGK